MKFGTCRCRDDDGVGEWGGFKAMQNGADLRLCGLVRCGAGEVSFFFFKINAERGGFELYIISCGFKLNFNFLHVIRVIKHYLLK